ncbi:MAG: hypothetical protein DI562_01930 [Stenotrophomonas acidaminiphila]|nr:MAG: hypothetical protein DI562_01930 [Stenotrophomonas acidaminiphila]
MPLRSDIPSAIAPYDDELDRADREDAVADAMAAAKALRLPVDHRCEALFRRYIAGEISDTQLVAEIKRPYLN